MRTNASGGSARFPRTRITVTTGTTIPEVGVDPITDTKDIEDTKDTIDLLDQIPTLLEDRILPIPHTTSIESLIEAGLGLKDP